MMKIFFTFIILVFVSLLVLLILNHQKKSAEKKLIDDYMQKTEDFINIENFDSAKTYLDLILSENNKSEIYDSAFVILTELKQLAELDINNCMKILLAMSNDEHQQFSNKTLDRNYLSHPTLNTYYINKLYAESENWFKDSSDDVAIVKSGSRKYYESVLKNSFLELGYDIDVTVTGEQNQVLILTSSFFDLEWFKKFKTSGDMDEWHNLGFSRIEITDGENFQKSFDW